MMSIASHTLTVVADDAVYVKPFDAPVMTARPYATGQGIFDNSTVAGFLEHEVSSKTLQTSYSVKKIKNKITLYKADLPPLNDTSFATNFTSKLRSLAGAEFPANVPQKAHGQFFFTVRLGTNPCPQTQTCQGPNGTMFEGLVNNVSFAMPTTALLQPTILVN
jgi:laccase